MRHLFFKTKELSNWKSERKVIWVRIQHCHSAALATHLSRMASAVRNSRRRSRSPSSHSGILYRSAMDTSVLSTNGQQDPNMFLPIVSSNPDAEVREINSNFHSPLEGSRDSLSGNDSPDQITPCGRFVRPDREDVREENLSKLKLSIYFLISH